MDDPHNGQSHVFEWAREALAIFAATVLGWFGWLYNRIARDRDILLDLDRERNEFLERFGMGLVESSQQILDAIEEQEQELNRCRKIHNGMDESDSAQKVIAGLRSEIAAVDKRIDLHVAEELEYKKRIATDVAWIREKLKG